MDIEAPTRPPDALTICAWCPDCRERTEKAVADGYTVSHSMCDACQQRMHAELDAQGVAK